MSVLRKLVFLALVAGGLLAGGGCMPMYQPLASHTLAVGPDQQIDVVWVLRDATLVLRCQNTAQGPVCVSANVQ